MVKNVKDKKLVSNMQLLAKVLFTPIIFVLGTIAGGYLATRELWK